MSHAVQADRSETILESNTHSGAIETGSIAKIWYDRYPTKDEVNAGVFVVCDRSRRSYEGRYVVAFRQQERDDHIAVGFIKQGHWAQLLAPHVADDLGLPLVLEQSPT